MVRAVLFDLFETLITESGTRPPSVASLASELGCEREAFRTEWRALRTAVTIGRLSFRQALGDISNRLGSHVKEATMQRLCDERIRAKAQPFEQIERQVLVMVGYLHRQGLRLGIISNCFAEDVAAWPQSPLAAHFDSTAFSFEIGLAKPDPAIYEEATRRLRVDASETWFIGDGMHDELAGAEQAGLRAFRALWFLKRWPQFHEEPSCAPSLACVDDVVTIVEKSNRQPEAASPRRMSEPH